MVKVYIGSNSGIQDYEFQINIPELKNQSPYPNEINVPINENLLTFDVVDYSPTLINLSSVDAYVDGYLAFSGGIFYPPFNAGGEYYSPISVSGQDGYRVVLDYSGGWNPSSTYIFRVLASNIAGTLDEYWSFTTSALNPPEIKDLVPLANSLRNDRLNRYIDLTIFSPVNTIIFESSLQVYINNELALLNNTFLDPFDGPDGYINATVDGYRIRVDYTDVPWNSYKSISVRALAEDAYGFSLDETYNYRIEDVRAPANVSTPIANQTDVDKDVNLTFQLFDRGCGVKQSEIKIYINSVLAYDGGTNSFNLNYSGPSSSIVANTYDGYDGYYIVIDPLNSFDSGEIVNIQVAAKDNEGN